MNTASNDHKYSQLKWLYSGLCGLCAAYFLALFSSSTSLVDSTLLQLATLFFAICLPVYATFSFAHIYMFELDLDSATCNQALEEPWVERVTHGSFLCLILAFMFLIGHFSINAMIGFILVSIICFYCLAEFTKKLAELARNKS